MSKESRVCTRCGASGPDLKFQSNSQRCRKCANEIWRANRLAAGEDPDAILRDKKAQRRALQRAGVPTEIMNPEHHNARRVAAERRAHYATQSELSGGTCHICGQVPTSRTMSGGTLVRDHDHENMSWRGVLCGKCNSGLGCFRENLVSLLRAREYLVTWAPLSVEQCGGLYSSSRKETVPRSVDARCDICDRTAAESGRRVLDQDHCHASGKKRGLLCHGCNKGLAAFQESLELLRSAAAYLTHWGRVELDRDLLSNPKDRSWTSLPVDHTANRAAANPLLLATGTTALRGRRRYEIPGEVPQNWWPDERRARSQVKDPATGRWINKPLNSL